MKDIMNELGEKATEVVKVIGKKTEEITSKTQDIVEIQRVKTQVRALEQNNEVDLCDLGEIIFAKYQQGEDVGADLAVICDEIKQRLVTISDLEKHIMELKGQDACQSCGKVIDKDALFCASCGAKIEKEEKEAEEEVSEESIFDEGDVVEVVSTEDGEIEIEIVVEEKKED